MWKEVQSHICKKGKDGWRDTVDIKRQREKKVQPREPEDGNNNPRLKLVSFFTNFFLCNSVM